MIVRFLAPALGLAALAACTEPVYSRSGMCGGRLAHWRPPADGIGDHVIFQPVRLTRTGAIDWNGRTIDEAQLYVYLRRIRTFETPMQTVLAVEDGAPCGLVVRVRTRMDRLLACRESLRCGEGTGWRRWPGAGPEA